MKINNFIQLKESLTTLEQKKKFLKVLKYIKEEYTGNIGGETDIRNADNLQVNEDEFTAATKPERNVVAKTFDTEGDFDSYVNQRRGIEMTPKEIQSITNFTKAKPTQKDKFFVKYESTDDFGNNDTTIIKKLRKENQFCWTAFSKHESAEGNDNNDKGNDSGNNDKEELPSLKEAMPPIQSSKPSIPSTNSNNINTMNKPENNDPEDITINDKIRITETITFTDEIEGANILADLLMKLDI